MSKEIEKLVPVGQPLLVRQFSQAGYIIVHPAKDDSGLPLIEEFLLTSRAAAERAKSLMSAYSQATYPQGLIVVPCKVLFDMPNAIAMASADTKTPPKETAL